VTPAFDKRDCPTCGERIALKAKKCRYCQEAVPALERNEASTSTDAPPQT